MSIKTNEPMPAPRAAAPVKTEFGLEDCMAILQTKPMIYDPAADDKYSDRELANGCIEGYR